MAKFLSLLPVPTVHSLQGFWIGLSLKNIHEICFFKHWQLITPRSRLMTEEKGNDFQKPPAHCAISA